MSALTLDQLRRIMPYAGPRCGLFLMPLNDAMSEFEIDTAARQAAFLAQVAHESGSLRYVREIASGLAYNGRADLGNDRPEALRIAAAHWGTPGPWWKGRGLLQLTGYENHRACGTALAVDLLHQPELLEQPIHACRSAAWYWGWRGLNTLADVGDFDGITRRVNGGYNGRAERLAIYDQACEVLSV